jgi:hypothetical protein
MIAFKPGAFAMPVTAEQAVGWCPSPGGGWSGGTPPRVPVHYSIWPPNEYRLTADEVPRLQEFWRDFRGIKDRRFRLACERLWRGVLQQDPRDAILEFVIGLEAICHVGEGELSFRLAGRAAAALGKTADERLRIFKEVRRAYKYRSAVVHGEAPRAEHAACENAERILRDSVHFWLREPALMEKPDQLDDRLVAGR